MTTRRALTPADRTAVVRTLRADAATGNVVSLRTRALIALAATSGLRLGEVTSLELGQLVHVLQGPPTPRLRVVRSFYLRAPQAKGRSKGAGMIAVGKAARRALRAYVHAALIAGWWSEPTAPAAARLPLFLAHRGHRGRAGHGRLSKRAAQWCWADVQRRSAIATPYPFHALRHDCASRLRAAGADLYDLMHAMRWRDANTAQHYVHELDAGRRLAGLQERAAAL